MRILLQLSDTTSIRKPHVLDTADHAGIGSKGLRNVEHRKDRIEAIGGRVYQRAGVPVKMTTLHQKPLQYHDTTAAVVIQTNY